MPVEEQLCSLTDVSVEEESKQIKDGMVATDRPGMISLEW